MTPVVMTPAGETEVTVRTHGNLPGLMELEGSLRFGADITVPNLAELLVRGNAGRTIQT